VLDAIRTERFYVITHDYNDAIETRMKNILAAKNPIPPQPSQVLADIVKELIRKDPLYKNFDMDVS
jgi:hypothetical protein